MKPSSLLLSAATLVLFSAAPFTASAQNSAQDKVSPPEITAMTEAPLKIQVALLLDTSSSMDGLIDQTKSQLWMLVNELAAGEKGGQKPQIELALYEYGNSGISVAKGYIRQVVSLTTDLDDVSEKLFALTTQGGQEYAGQVITTAIDELEWSESSEDMKLVIIAGNEPFTQGPVTYQSACARAQSKGVIIDTIHCGDEKTGIDTKWKAGADCGGGVYMTINQDEESVYIASPYDADIIALNKKMNDTYVGYGFLGRQNKERQAVQDSNAAGMSVKSSISRAKSKASAQYKNESWDIVDAFEADETEVMNLKDEALPDEMKGMSAEEKTAFIQAKKSDREAISAKINALQDKQKAFVAKEKAAMAKTNTLEEVVVTAVRAQAEKSGFTFKE